MAFEECSVLRLGLSCQYRLTERVLALSFDKLVPRNGKLNVSWWHACRIVFSSALFVEEVRFLVKNVIERRIVVELEFVVASRRGWCSVVTSRCLLYTSPSPRDA